MSSDTKAKPITSSTLSIGIGGMVGGDVFAVTGLTVAVTKGAAPDIFLIVGLVALLISYFFSSLRCAFPEKEAPSSFWTGRLAMAP